MNYFLKILFVAPLLSGCTLAMNNYIKNDTSSVITVAVTGAVPVRHEGELSVVKELKVPANSTCNVWTSLGDTNYLYLLEPMESKVGTGILAEGKRRYVIVYSVNGARYQVDFERVSKKMRKALENGDGCVENSAL